MGRHHGLTWKTKNEAFLFSFFERLSNHNVHKTFMNVVIWQKSMSNILYFDINWIVNFFQLHYFPIFFSLMCYLSIQLCDSSYIMPHCSTHFEMISHFSRLKHTWAAAPTPRTPIYLFNSILLFYSMSLFKKNSR